MLLYLVRHGQTESNRKGLALGRADVPLNDLGRRQADWLRQALASETLAAVYSSPLQRTRDTATRIAAPHGLDVRLDERLVEMDIGEADGLTFAEVRERYPGLLETWVSEGGPTEPMPGGERLLDVQERAWSAVEGLAAEHGDEAVVAVTHNFVILSLLTRALGLELSRFRRLRHVVAAISVVEFGADGTTVLRMNDTCHLEDG